MRSFLRKSIIFGFLLTDGEINYENIIKYVNWYEKRLIVSNYIRGHSKSKGQNEQIYIQTPVPAFSKHRDLIFKNEKDRKNSRNTCSLGQREDFLITYLRLCLIRTNLFIVFTRCIESDERSEKASKWDFQDSKILKGVCDVKC